jgi:hypothetical protein
MVVSQFAVRAECALADDPAVQTYITELRICNQPRSRLFGVHGVRTARSSG